MVAEVKIECRSIHGIQMFFFQTQERGSIHILYYCYVVLHLTVAVVVPGKANLKNIAFPFFEVSTIGCVRENK